jgi:hypothetical protein
MFDWFIGPKNEPTTNKLIKAISFALFQLNPFFLFVGWFIGP